MESYHHIVWLAGANAIFSSFVRTLESWRYHLSAKAIWWHGWRWNSSRNAGARKKIQSRILRISFLICDILHRLDKEKKKSFFILFLIILEPIPWNITMLLWNSVKIAKKTAYIQYSQTLLLKSYGCKNTSKQRNDTTQFFVRAFVMHFLGTGCTFSPSARGVTNSFFWCV